MEITKFLIKPQISIAGLALSLFSCGSDGTNSLSQILPSLPNPSNNSPILIASDGNFQLSETISASLTGQIRIDLASPETLPPSLMIQSSVYHQTDLEIVPGYVSYIASLETFTQRLSSFEQIHLPGVSQAQIQVTVLGEPSDSSERVALLYEGNPTQVTTNDVLLLFAFRSNPDLSLAELVAQVNAFGADPPVTMIDPPLTPTNTDWNSDGILDLRDVAVVVAANNLPFPLRTPTNLAALANSFLSGTPLANIQPKQISVIPGSGLFPGESSMVELAWIRQFGTFANDQSSSIAVAPGGTIFVTGFTQRRLGEMNFGAIDPYLARYDSDGNQIWVQQIGSDRFDDSNGVALDGQGNIFISGSTAGNIVPGDPPREGPPDAWVGKFDAEGNLIWIQQLGTENFQDISYETAADLVGNVYITGSTSGQLGETAFGNSDAWVAKYDPDGTLQWVEQIGSPAYDDTNGIGVDSNGNTYISGRTGGSIGNNSSFGDSDAWVAKYDPEGSLLWVKQIGTAVFDTGNSVAVDRNDNFYLAGRTQGSLGGELSGDNDAWVGKYDPDGNQIWIRQLGTEEYDYSSSVAVDIRGNVYTAGRTRGSLGGEFAGATPDEEDYWVASYTATGDLVWIEQLGTAGFDSVNGLAADAIGNVYLSGFTNGSLGESSFGANDAWVAKYVQNGN